MVEPAADRRFPAGVEAAVYFCCVEALRAGSTRIELAIVGEELVVQVRGVAPGAIDVQSIVDRVEAVGGRSLLDDPLVLSVGIPVSA
jgi:hypothetical protein